MTLTTPLESLRPGDVVTHLVTRSSGLVEIHDGPRMVLHPLTVIDRMSGTRAVELHTTGSVQYMLHEGQVLAARVASRTRGYASRDAAVRAARQAVGWTSKGGCYFAPLPGTRAAWGYQGWEYTGVRGLDQAGPEFTFRGWIVLGDRRWFVTPAAARHAADWAVRDVALLPDGRALTEV